MTKFNESFNHVIERKDEVQSEPKTATLEMIVEDECVSVPVQRFEELIKTEMIANIVRTAYEKRTSWDLEATVALLFPDAVKEGAKNAE